LPFIASPNLFPFSSRAIWYVTRFTETKVTAVILPVLSLVAFRFLSARHGCSWPP
jgi:hypothetical protein